MSGINKARGLRRIFRSVVAGFQPVVPFDDKVEGKGAWEWCTRAPRHVWRSHELALSGWPVGERPLRMVVISDLHVGSHARDLDRLTAIIDEVVSRDYDIALLPGDFVNMQVFGGGRFSPHRIARLLEPVASKYPTFAVMGNHDAEYGCAEIAGELADTGISVLQNENVVCRTALGDIAIHGLDDESTGRPKASLVDNHEKLVPAIVLTHDPATFVRIPAGPVLTIAGHTHGGQVRLPFVGAVVNASDAPLSWSHGHVQEEGRHMIVSAGLGTSGLPWRLNCPPEIVEIAVRGQ